MSQTKKRSTNRSYHTKANIYQKARLQASRQPDTHGSHSGSGSIIATIAGVALALLVVAGFVLIGIIGHGKGTATASGGGSGTVPVGYGSLNHPKGPCGNAGQAACTAAQPNWFSTSSASAAAVAAAIAGSSDYLSMQAQYGYVTLDTPALVHAYAAHTGIAYYDSDHWVVSVRNAAGMRCGLFDFVYDAAHQRLRFSSYGVITAADPHAQQAFLTVSGHSGAEQRAQAGRQNGNAAGINLFPD